MKKKELYLIYGIRPIIEAIHAGKTIEKVLLLSNIKGSLTAELREVLANAQVPYQRVPEHVFNKLGNRNHQGAVAYISPIPYYELEEIVVSDFEKGKNALYLMADRVTDVRNFGAIVRSAECFGVSAVFIPAKGTAALQADAIKTSAGALTRMPVARVKDIVQATEYLKDSGFSVIGLTEKGDINIGNIEVSGPTVLIMGSEEDGIRSELLKLCDYKCFIPMQGHTASLNVSVAAGIGLFHISQKINP